MVAGIAFLSKKSWHVKNLANQEKVWVAEQRKEQEEAKAKELAKQISQEKEQEELDKIAGKRSTRMDRGIDWMYSGQQKNSEIAQEDAAKKSEEYLLGKAYVPEGQVVGDFDAGADVKEGVNAVIEAKKPPPVQQDDLASHKEPTVADRNEAFRMRHEDPMFAVAMEAKHKHDDYQKKKDLFERVVGVRAESDSDDERARKRRRKEKKHKKKKKHKSHRRHQYSSDEESSLDDHRKSSHHRHDGKRHRRLRSPDSVGEERRHRRQSRDREEYSSRRKERSDRYHDDRRSHGRSRRSYSSEEDYSYDDRKRRASRRERPASRSPDYDREYDRKRKDPPNDDRTFDRRQTRDREDVGSKEFIREKKPGYGLQSGSASAKPPPSEFIREKKPGYGLQSGSASAKPRPSDLGPDRELLRKKQKEREEEIERNRRQSSRRKMTAEEREAALREMQESAHVYQTRRERRPDTDDQDELKPQASAAFLNSVAQKAHGVSGATMSLHERISQNRSTNQKLHEDFV